MQNKKQNGKKYRNFFRATLRTQALALLKGDRCNIFAAGLTLHKHIRSLIDEQKTIMREDYEIVRPYVSEDLDRMEKQSLEALRVYTHIIRDEYDYLQSILN